jgi:hypothetical protein
LVLSRLKEFLANEEDKAPNKARKLLSWRLTILIPRGWKIDVDTEQDK